jgi:3-hydroxyisobutyrate dehydrogenase-like beta-hydroxyacid dehydrogenase
MQQHKQQTVSRPSVGLIGTGIMGTALARRLIERGITNTEPAAGETGPGGLTVWNRTPSKAQTLVSLGAKLAATVSECVESSEFIILVVSDYDTCKELLDNESVGPLLKGKIILQLTTGTAANARDFEALTKRLGARLLEGAILGPTNDLEMGTAPVYVSGETSLYDKYTPFLKKFCVPAFVGEVISNANVLDEAALTFFAPAMFGFLQGMAVCEREQFPKENFWELVQQLCPALPNILLPLYDKITSKRYEEEVNSTLSLEAAWFDRAKKNYDERGMDGRLFSAMGEITKDTIKFAETEKGDVALIYEYMLENKKKPE